MSTQPDHGRRQHIPPQLRPLAPKLPCHLVSPVQYRLQLEHNKIQDEQHTEAPEAATVNFKPQHPAASQSSIPLKSVSPGHGFTLPPFPSPGSMVSNLQRQQHMDIYCNRVPSTSLDSGFPELGPGNRLSGVATCESHGLLIDNPPYSNLRFQGTIQNHYSGDYWMLGAPEDAVWTTTVQPTFGVHQSQLSQCTINQYPPMSPKPLPPPAVQPAHHAQLLHGLQHMTCANCPLIWRSHLESILFSDQEDKGISDLKRSYRNLQQHIHEAHQCACPLCENLFCYHLGKMMVLEAAKGDFTDLKIDLGTSSNVAGQGGGSIRREKELSVQEGEKERDVRIS
ncbi:hypothetical protein BGX38DRAFT_1268792 [Terfezia claveryi]|nr:hypothetical protein BGX38DRAFT_1268792 [Terfezia claveryi]